MRIKHIGIKNFRGIKSLSWHVRGDFNCIIGAGDSCKTTILTALDYALAPRFSLGFDDADFFNQDVTHDIIVQVTLSDWDETQDEIRGFFQERKFAQYKCGCGDAGPLAEPAPGGMVAVSISLRVDKSLEPKWHVVRGWDGDNADKAPIYASDRAVLGLSRLDLFTDVHFTWGRNTILSRLSADNQGNLNDVLSGLAREMRQADIAAHPSIVESQAIADTVKSEAAKVGVKLTGLAPRIDIQRRSAGGGALSLHEESVPLRNKGSGSKKLIGAAMQMRLHGGKNISLIDELEMGLEPHRIRGLIYKLKQSGQQIFTTTHSPVVVRELQVANNELYVCKRDEAGTVSLQSLGTVPEIQGPVRSNAEAFLGTRIVACEGATEIGCLRAYDLFRFAGGGGNAVPVWSLATAYFNCGGGGKIKGACPRLVDAGYETAVLCDNDAPEQLSDDDVEALRRKGIHVCLWEIGNSTERQLFAEIPWPYLPALLAKICESHDRLGLASVIDLVRKESRFVGQDLGNDAAGWPESAVLREVIGHLAHEGGWFKRIDYAEEVFGFCLPHLPDAGILKTRLDALWRWIQR